VIAAACGVALFQEPRVDGAALTKAAQAFLAGLTTEQRKTASAALEDPSRTVWNFVPQAYPGVMLGDLDAAGRDRAITLLQCVLSDRGLAKVQSIIALEDVLRELETKNGQKADHRDPRRYWLQVFGEPEATGAWAFRLQGHHVSLHFAIERGRVVGATPLFLGTNPHQIPSGPRAGERVLGREEDLARGFLALLDANQRAAAIRAMAAPADIVLGPGRTAAEAGEPQGIAYADLTALQREMLLRLIEEFVRNERAEVADDDLRRMRERGLDAIHFAWAGGTGHGQGHYYRIQGPTFVIEYDNTQNQANHVHTVYRDLQRDFGGDALREHYARDHKPK
jgi:hypothetical protein